MPPRPEELGGEDEWMRRRKLKEVSTVEMLKAKTVHCTHVCVYKPHQLVLWAVR